MLIYKTFPEHFYIAYAYDKKNEMLHVIFSHASATQMKIIGNQLDLRLTVSDQNDAFKSKVIFCESSLSLDTLSQKTDETEKNRMDMEVMNEFIGNLVKLI